MKKTVWYIYYLYPKQNLVFSLPNYYEAETEEDFNRAMEIAKNSNYDVIKCGTIEVDR